MKNFWLHHRYLKKLLIILMAVLWGGLLLLLIMVMVQNYHNQKLFRTYLNSLPKHHAATTNVILADGRLEVDAPNPNETVGQSFTVSGYAQGWFEGNIVIKVFDDNNNKLYQGNTIARDNYNYPAPFNSVVKLTATSTTSTGKIEFDDYSAKDGRLTYQKIVPITFLKFIN